MSNPAGFPQLLNEMFSEALHVQMYQRKRNRGLRGLCPAFHCAASTGYSRLMASTDSRKHPRVNRYDLQSGRIAVVTMSSTCCRGLNFASGNVSRCLADEQTDATHPTKKVNVTVHAYACQPPV
jgi:hypothetical protein